MDLRDASARADHVCEKCTFPGVAFDQMDAQRGRPITPEDGEHETGETGAAAEIEKHPRAIGNQGKKLGRIENVAAPDVGKTGVADQVNSGLPSLKGCDHNLKPPDLFAREAELDAHVRGAERRRGPSRSAIRRRGGGFT